MTKKLVTISDGALCGALSRRMAAKTRKAEGLLKVMKRIQHLCGDQKMLDHTKIQDIWREANFAVIAAEKISE